MSPILFAGSLALVLAAGACATSPADSGLSTPSAAVEADTAGADTAEADTALVGLIREPDGSAVVTVTFRSEGGAGGRTSIGPGRALRVETPSGTFEAPIDGEPRRQTDGVTTESSADYRLAEPGVLAMERAGERARVSVHDGQRYRTHAVRRVDFLE